MACVKRRPTLQRHTSRPVESTTTKSCVAPDGKLISTARSVVFVIWRASATPSRTETSADEVSGAPPDVRRMGGTGCDCLVLATVSFRLARGPTISTIAPARRNRKTSLRDTSGVPIGAARVATGTSHKLAGPATYQHGDERSTSRVTQTALEAVT